MKHTCEGSSQTDKDKVFNNGSHDCLPKVQVTNACLTQIDEKLNRLLKLIPELESYGNWIFSLKDEQKSIQESLLSSQTEVKEVKDLQDNAAKQQEAFEASLQRIKCELSELQRQNIKLECHSCRGNLKFFGIKEHDH